MGSSTNILIYLLRHDLRASDNPILHHLATKKDHGFTHLLPVYVFPAHQIETSGFIRDGSKSPYPEARSQVGKFWRCGPHRAKFIAQSVWDLKESFQGLGSDLFLRAGKFDDVLQGLLKGFSEKQQKVGAVWMTEEVAEEEKRDEKAVASVCAEHGVDLKMWLDEKYLIDDRDTGLDDTKDLPDVFTTYRKTQEPLRERPRSTVPKPEKSTLPPLPDASVVPEQEKPFEMSTTRDDLESALLSPVRTILDDAPEYPKGAKSVHPFDGGETQAQERVDHLIKTLAMSKYKETRNGLLGTDFSTKLSAFLALGCISARQIHESLVRFEDGKSDQYKGVEGFGGGPNNGTQHVRFELLWRDYMRLCTKKFGPKLFLLSGFRDDKSNKWKYTSPDGSDDTSRTLQRILAGTTGQGLIDASQRELLHTGYTSNRARQNVASFLAKHLDIDWRLGAEWYECLLIDYDVCSNWANWQYVAGVGNDPRGEARIFNPVKQAFDYDKAGEYVKAWVPEVRDLPKLENVFQPWTTSHEELEKVGLVDHQLVKDPVKKIDFSVDGKPKGSRKPYMRRRGRGGHHNGGNGNNGGNNGGGNGGNNHNNHSGSSQGNSDGGGAPNGHANGHHSQDQGPPRQPQSYTYYTHQGQSAYAGQGYRGNGGYRGQSRGYRGNGGGNGGGRGGYGGYRGGAGGGVVGGGYNGYGGGRGFSTGFNGRRPPTQSYGGGWNNAFVGQPQWQASHAGYPGTHM